MVQDQYKDQYQERIEERLNILIEQHRKIMEEHQAIINKLNELKQPKNPKWYDYCCLATKTTITVGATLAILTTYQGPPHQFPQAKIYEIIAVAAAQPISENICSIPYFFPKIKDAIYYGYDKAHEGFDYLVDAYYGDRHHDEL